MADWLSGYSVEWSVYEVDPDTWADSRILANAVPKTVTRDCDGDAPLLETADMTIDSDGRFSTAWLRVYMTVTDSAAEKLPVATMLFERDSRRTEHAAPLLTCKGRSVLQPAQDVDLLAVDPKGYAAAGSDGAAYAASLISACTPAPVSVEGSFTLNDSRNFDPAAKCLEAAWEVLKAGGFVIQVSGDGTVRVRRMPSEPALELGGANAGLLVPGVDDANSLVDVPNRYTAVLDGEVATAVNDDPNSEAGYGQRGRWVDAKRDTSPTLVNGEDLQAYAERKLAEVSKSERTFKYTREFWPDVTCFDLVRATMAANGVEGLLRVRRQTITCGLGAPVEEEAYEEVAA